MYYVKPVGEAGRYYSEIGDAIAFAAESAVILARATHSDVEVLISNDKPNTLLWSIQARQPRSAGGWPRLSIVNLF